MSYRVVLVLYTIFFLVMTVSYWGRGDVIAPHRQFSELAATDTSGTEYLENRKFSDFTNFYIPEITEHLEGKRSGSFTLWTDKNELGRPIYHTAGYSPVYLFSFIIAKITDNPWRFITVLSLVICFLSGIFIILFSREMKLNPLAGLIAGTSLAASPLFMYWLTFPMFPAVWCWSAGILWAFTRLAKKEDLIGWCGGAFCAYSLLITAYPQTVVYHVYILGGYGLYLIFYKCQRGVYGAIKFVLSSISALVVAAILALPVYIDLAHTAIESARATPDPSFFTMALPRFDSLISAIRFFVLGMAPELYGRPIDSQYPFSYDGLSITPLVLFFVIFCFLVSFRRVWGWWLVVVVLLLLTFIPSLYALGVKYLGFNLSRSTPLGSIMLPLVVIAAFGVDALTKRAKLGELSLQVLTAAASVFAIIIISVVFGLVQAVTIRWTMVVIMFILVGLFAVQWQKTRPNLLIVAMIIILATISYPLMLRQDPKQIAITSPLIEKVRENLPVGSRFALMPGLAVLPPNLNAELGLGSVHSYNSLSSRRYHTLINALGGEMQTYGRWNSFVSPDYNSVMFWMSNISLILSPDEILHENLEYLGKESGIHLYKVISRMGRALQVIFPLSEMEKKEVRYEDLQFFPKYSVAERVNQGDFLEFDVIPGMPSVLILSQKFHHDWHPQIFKKSGWVTAETTVVNDVFQGVLLPHDIQRVRLVFEPWSRYAWIANVFWFLLFMILGSAVLWRRYIGRHKGISKR